MFLSVSDNWVVYFLQPTFLHIFLVFWVFVDDYLKNILILLSFFKITWEFIFLLLLWFSEFFDVLIYYFRVITIRCVVSRLFDSLDIDITPGKSFNIHKNLWISIFFSSNMLSKWQKIWASAWSLSTRNLTIWLESD